MNQLHDSKLSDECFANYANTIQEIMGISIRKNRKTMLVGRIRKRLNELEIDHYEEYLKIVITNKAEKENFINLITTNETYFYRTPRIWRFIERKFLNDCYFSKNDKTIRIWSAAASSGEEAYTLGIICQNFKNMHPDFEYEIIGTDISASIIKKAKKGIYKGRSIKQFRKLKPELFKSYMTGNDSDGYQVIPSIRNNISFDTENLFELRKLRQSFNLILLRNVLIYFSKIDQIKAITNVMKYLSHNGNLIIGESESLSNLDVNVRPIEPLVYKSL